MIFDFHGLIFAHLNLNNQLLQIDLPHLKSLSEKKRVNHSKQIISILPPELVNIDSSAAF